MIIQVKSSYSDVSSQILEENQELFICHAPEALAPEKHAYIQKEADAHAVARMYLVDGIVHLTPIRVEEGILLQNKPFTADVKIGYGNLLQIWESLLVFEVYKQTVTIMMGLVPGYKSTTPKKVIKVTGGATPTPSLPITPISVSPLKPKTAQPSSEASRVAADMKKTPAVPIPQKPMVVKQPESEELSETDILQSESTTTTMKFSGGRPVSDKDVTLKISKGMLVAIAVCAVIVLCAITWFIFSGKREVSASPPEHVAENNTTVTFENDGRPWEKNKQIGKEEENMRSQPMSSDKVSVSASEKAGGESIKSFEKQNDVVTDGNAVSVGKNNTEMERTETIIAVKEQKTVGILSENVKQSESGVNKSNLLGEKTESIDDELSIAKKQYVTASKTFEEKLNNRLDNNQVYVQLWKVFREMRPSEEDWKTVEDYHRGVHYYETLNNDLVLAVKITALKQENEKAEREQLLDQLQTKIEGQKGIILESARKACLEQNLDINGIDKDFVFLSKTIEGAIGEVSKLEDEIAKIIKTGRNGNHLKLIQVDTKELNEIWGKRKTILQNLEKDVTEIHEFEKLLKNGLEIRRQSEALTTLYNTLNTGEKVDFKKIDDAYQLLGKSYDEIKAIDGLPPDVWKILSERKELEEKFYKEAKEVLNVK